MNDRNIVRLEQLSISCRRASRIVLRSLPDTADTQAARDAALLAATLADLILSMVEDEQDYRRKIDEEIAAQVKTALLNGKGGAS